MSSGGPALEMMTSCSTTAPTSFGYEDARLDAEADAGFEHRR
jgi:hypothetical protein